MQDIFGPIPSSDEIVKNENILYMYEFNKGQKINLSSGIPLLKCVKYKHVYNGIPILGDVLSVSISKDEVIKSRVCWHKFKAEIHNEKKKVKNVEESLLTAVNKLSKKHNGKKKKFKLSEATLCYYGFHDSGKSNKIFKPVWRFGFENKGKRYYEYVDAHNNKSIASKYDLDIAKGKLVK